MSEPRAPIEIVTEYFRGCSQPPGECLHCAHGALIALAAAMGVDQGAVRLGAGQRSERMPAVTWEQRSEDLTIADPTTDRGPIVGIPLRDLGDMRAEIERSRATIRQMQEDFRRIEMLAQQHCPADETAT